MGQMLVMGCRGNVGVVSRAVVESQDGVVGHGQAGMWTMMDDGDRERGEGCVFAGRRVGCEMFGVGTDEKEEEERLAVMAGDVRRFGVVAARDGCDEVLHASKPV